MNTDNYKIWRLNRIWRLNCCAVRLAVKQPIDRYLTTVLTNVYARQRNWVFTRSDRRTDRSVRLVCPTGRSDCRSVWTLRPTGRNDWPVGRPITLQRRRYYNQLAGHIDLIDRCGRFGYSLSDRFVRLVWETVGHSLGRTDRLVRLRRSYRVNAQIHWYSVEMVVRIVAETE